MRISDWSQTVLFRSQQPVVYMHRDCEVCRSEGFAAMTRVRLDVGARTLVATLNVVVDDRLGLDEVALSEAAWTLLDPMRDALARVRHAEPASSAGALRDRKRTRLNSSH